MPPHVGSYSADCVTVCGPGKVGLKDFLYGRHATLRYVRVEFEKKKRRRRLCWVESLDGC